MSTRTAFYIEKHQYLNSDGQWLSDMPLDIELAKTLYQTMQRTRAFDEKAIKLQRTGKMGTYASSLGQEAVFAAIGHAMQTDDTLIPYYRDYAAFLARGVSMQEIYTYWGGSEWGNAYKASHDFPMCVPIASQCLHAAGVAKAMQYKNIKQAVVVTIGEGGTSEGDFYEALNIAGAWRLPMVFVVNNNQWAISVARRYQTGAITIAQKAIAGGFAGEQVDGNDALGLHARIQAALEKAYRGEGPTLIEALTYRLCDHTTADDASRYIDPDAQSQAFAEEPLIRMRKCLSQNAWTEQEDKALLATIQTEVADAVKAYTERTPAKVTDMFDYHYENLPRELIEQRQIVKESLK